MHRNIVYLRAVFTFFDSIFPTLGNFIKCCMHMWCYECFRYFIHQICHKEATSKPKFWLAIIWQFIEAVSVAKRSNHFLGDIQFIICNSFDCREFFLWRWLFFVCCYAYLIVKWWGNFFFIFLVKFNGGQEYSKTKRMNNIHV